MKKNRKALAARAGRELLNLIVKMGCPTCGATSDVTGIDENVRLWPHNIGGAEDGKPCPTGEQKVRVLDALAARSAPASPRPHSRRAR